MTSQTLAEPALLPEVTDAEEVVHGYPPPVQPAGRAVTAYCGAPMTVRGEATPAPPIDTCPECITVWQQRRRAARHGPSGVR